MSKQCPKSVHHTLSWMVSSRTWTRIMSMWTERNQKCILSQSPSHTFPSMRVQERLTEVVLKLQLVERKKYLLEKQFQSKSCIGLQLDMWTNTDSVEGCTRARIMSMWTERNKRCILSQSPSHTMLTSCGKVSHHVRARKSTWGGPRLAPATAWEQEVFVGETIPSQIMYWVTTGHVDQHWFCWGGTVHLCHHDYRCGAYWYVNTGSTVAPALRHCGL